MKYKDIQNKIKNLSPNTFYKIYINKDIFYTNDLLISPMNYSKYVIIKMYITLPNKKDIKNIKEKFIITNKIQCIFEIYLKEVKNVVNIHK